MGRPKLNESDKKIKLSVTISKEASEKLESLTTNKSKYIETIILK
jgi:hypothetical protein